MVIGGNIILLCRYRKIKVWDAGNIVKWNGIIDKITFWDGKIE